MKKIAILLVILMSLSVFAACGGTTPAASPSGSTAPSGSAAPSGNHPTAIKVGVLNPSTGALAGMGEGTPYLDNYFVDYINNTLGGIYIKDYDAKLPVQLVYYDTGSSSDNASALTAKMITEDKVNIILARHTPDMVVPTTATAEQYGVPTIATDCPGGPWLGQGDHYWSFLSAPDDQTYYNAYSSIWKAAGYKAGDANATIGLIFANDVDGTILGPSYKEKAETDGFKTLDPGLYAAGTNDFTSLIQKFQQNNIEIVFGVMINPEFSAFWAQCQQLGYQPKVVVVGKAYMLESQALAVGADLMDGMCNEVWWDVHFPFVSKTMNQSASAFGDKYLADTGNKAAGPQGAKYASWELLIDVLSRSANLDAETIHSAIAATDLDTIMGHIKYNDLNFCPTVCVGGQWVLNADGKTMSQEIVSNPDASNGIVTTAPVKTSGFAWQK